MKKTTRFVLFALMALLAAPSWAYDKDKLYQIVSVKFPDKAWTYADGVTQVSLKAWERGRALSLGAGWDGSACRDGRSDDPGNQP